MGAATLVVLTLLPAAPASADSTCTFENNKMKIRLNDDGSAGAITRDAALITFNGTPCSGSSGIASVLNTDEINVKDTTNGGSTGFIVDLSGGQFQGAGDPIPMVVELKTGTRDQFAVAGSSSGDFMFFGAGSANLQDDTDAEINFVTSPDIGLAAGLGGDDKICAKGEHGTGVQSFILWGIAGGDGSDTICGGGTTDILSGGSGIDRLKGEDGGDILRGKSGDDRLVGKSGNDRLFGNKGGDVLFGGGGIDLCKGGQGSNVTRNCE